MAKADKTFRNLSQNHGFALVENVLAVALISAVALGGLAMMGYFTKRTSLKQNQCKQYATQILEKLRSEGQVALINNYAPTLAHHMGSDAIPNGYSDPFLTSTASRWPAPLPVLDNAAIPHLGNSILIDGSINTLLAIYNSGVNFCSAPQNVNVAGSILTTTTGTSLVYLPGLSQIGNNLNSNANTTIIPQLQIIPYDTRSGVPTIPLVGAIPQCASYPAPQYIAPPGMYGDNDTTPADTNPDLYPNLATGVSAIAGSIVTWAPGVSDHLGLLVRVFLTYTDSVNNSNAASNQIIQTCMEQQSFQYVQDNSPPPIPNSFTSSITVTGGSPGNACAAPVNNQVTINLGYSASASQEAGTVLLCADESENPLDLVNTAPVPIQPVTSNPPAAPPYYIYGCYSGPAAARTFQGLVPAQEVGAPPSNVYASAWGVGSMGLTYQQNTPPGGHTVPSWVPCDQVTVCGSPVASTVETNAQPVGQTSVGGVGTAISYTLKVSNVTPGCRIRMKIGAIDTAANMTEAIIPGGNTLPAYTLASDVPIPTCNPALLHCASAASGIVWSAACGTACWQTTTTPADGYFVCGGNCN